ncbi:MAG: kelch repeat-containing protein [Bacteroidota bacterium]
MYFVGILIVCGLMMIIQSCDDDEDEDLIGNWVELSEFEGYARSDAVGFTINNTAYITTGYNGDGRLTDLWEYNSEEDVWTQKADFPGAPRNAAVAFGTSSKGYIGTGYDGDSKLSDFWEYDPVLDSWSQIADFPGTARYGAIAFAIGDKGYVGSGYDGSYLKDFWEYDSGTGEWTKKTSIGGSKRKDAVSFVIDGMGYVCTGISSGSYETDFLMYDPSLDKWTKKRAIANATDEDFDDEYSTLTGKSGVAFTIGHRGYLITESNNVWEYDPVADLWEQKTSLEGSTRTEAIGFTVNDIGYVVTGRSGSSYFEDVWTLYPDDEYDEYD